MHDKFIRAIFADKEIAISYFTSCLPSAVSQHLDFTTLTQIPDTYLSEELRKSMSDIVYACQRKEGKGSVRVCLLIEHKSAPDIYTPIQMGRYIFSALQKQVDSKDLPLSMVIPVLLYHGKDKWEYQTLAGLFEDIELGWQQFLPDFAYIYNNLGDISDAQLATVGNKFLEASMLALKHSFEKVWLGKNTLKLLVLAADASDGLQRSFIIYLFDRNELKEPDITEIFASASDNIKNKVMSTLDYFIEKGIEKGVEKGRQEMAEKKNYEFVCNLLATNKFTIAEIASLASVTEAFVIKVKEGLG